MRLTKIIQYTCSCFNWAPKIFVLNLTDLFCASIFCSVVVIVCFWWYLTDMIPIPILLFLLSPSSLSLIWLLHFAISCFPLSFSHYPVLRIMYVMLSMLFIVEGFGLCPRYILPLWLHTRILYIATTKIFPLGKTLNKCWKFTDYGIFLSFPNEEFNFRQKPVNG